MRIPVILLFLFSALSVSAKKLPHWPKKARWMKTASGLEYSVVKKGKGDSIRVNDKVTVDFIWYKKSDGSVIYSSQADYPKGQEVTVGDASVLKGISEAIRLLKKGGKGYFKIPPALGFGANRHPGEDTLYYYIAVKKVTHTAPEISPINVPPVKDSTNIVVVDPDKSRFGDTLFTTLKLVDLPPMLRCNGIAPVMQAVKFRMRWFDNGVQQKDILIYIECPAGYGADFFVPGASYVITAIPLLENHKQRKQVQNIYSAEKLEEYYCLRIRKA